MASTKPKSFTAEALSKKRLAAHKRALLSSGAGHSLDRRDVEALEAEAAELLQLDHPPVTNMGEVVAPQVAGLPQKRKIIQDTLKSGDRVAEEASIRRTDLLLQDSLDVTALAVDAADSIKAENSMEKMLAHQMAVVHEMAMKMSNAAMAELADQTPGIFKRGMDATEIQRLTNCTAKLMDVYQRGLLTLMRLRSGGNQTVTVQHVHLAEGSQAVIGNVQTPGVAGKGDKGEK